MDKVVEWFNALTGRGVPTKRLVLVMLLAIALAGSALAQAAGEYVFLTKWGSWGSDSGQFKSPRGIAVDTAGNVYVADYYNHRVQKFSSTGSFLTAWGSEGSGNGQFKDSAWPAVSGAGIAVDAAGNVYVVDQGNSRVQKFTSTGSFITAWGSLGSGNGQFEEPAGIAVDAAGNVYVSDWWNRRIQKFTSTGSFLTAWGSWGGYNGEFEKPYGVAVDAAGNVYVADYYNTRILKFTSTGSFLTTWGSYGSGNGQFYCPAGIAMDAAGNVYVTDTCVGRIQKFSSTGTFLTAWGSQGSGNGQFSSPVGIAVNAAGNVYVVDQGDSRIQVFSSTSAVPTPTPTPVPAVAIRNVHASPNPFNPAQAGTTLSFDLTTPCGNTLAAIFDMNGAGVLKYWALGARSAGTQSVSWDGKSSGGSTLGEGMYAYFAVCLDAGGQALAVGYDLLNISPIISNMTISPKPYYPQAGNATLGFNLCLASSGFTTAVIINAQGAQVKAFPWAVSPSGAVGYSWDGKDSGGNVVPNGRYTYIVAAVDPSNMSQMHVGAMLFDVGTPIGAGAAQAEPWAQEAMEQLRGVGGGAP
ncbi:MAG: hypothetical protein EPO21_15960 [Chloroflexota bacterium]|nr:MAG: hypothetical protein EPO21_15960 [Chloroflexota bacterium]